MTAKAPEAHTGNAQESQQEKRHSMNLLKVLGLVVPVGTAA